MEEDFNMNAGKGDGAVPASDFPIDGFPGRGGFPAHGGEDAGLPGMHGYPGHGFNDYNHLDYMNDETHWYDYINLNRYLHRHMGEGVRSRLTMQQMCIHSRCCMRARPLTAVRASRSAERAQRLFDVILVLSVLFLVVSCIRFHYDGVKNWWRRRVAAARYKRMKKSDTESGAVMEVEPAAYASGPEDEPTFMETLKASITRDKQVTCVIDLGAGAKAHTIDASVGQLEKVSELPFHLQDACRYSGIGEVAALSLVDLWLKERALLELVRAEGGTKVVGKGTTPAEVRRAKSFKVTILPQSTR